MSDPVTPAMGLTQPIVLGTPGPDYASEMNDNSDLIDQHDHSSGKGVQITPAGINITSDLTFASNAATHLSQTAYDEQSAPLSSSLLSRIYFSGGELYANDGSGNRVQITLGGAVNTGSTGNISGLTSPASASYSSVTKTFTWAQAANQTAHMSMASAILHRGATTSEASVTLTPPVGLVGSYTVTMPGSLPGSTVPVQMDSSGTLSVPSTLPASFVVTASIADAAVTTVKIADANVTQAKLAAKPITTGSSSGSYSNSTTTPTDICDSGALTSTGRPAAIVFQSSSSSTGGQIQVQAGVGGQVQVLFNLQRNGVTIVQTRAALSSANGQFFQIPPGSLNFIDTGASAGSNTYKLQAAIVTATAGTVSVTNCLLIAYEL